uniref:Uncharacterized protein n=1 Tax=Arundo donax TaxID=35708 RepID=A0A0A8Y3P8_ARUDO
MPPVQISVCLLLGSSSSWLLFMSVLSFCSQHISQVRHT